MKKILLIILATFFIFLTSCEKESSSVNINDAFVYGKTSIIFDDIRAHVNTENTYSDFLHNTLLISEKIEVIDGYIKSKIDENLWFVPFDKNDVPILLNQKSNVLKSNGGITISCNCVQGSINLCSVESSTNGNVTTFECEGTCTSPSTGNSVGDCRMLVAIENKVGALSEVDILNGIILTSKELVFNGVMYKK